MLKDYNMSVVYHHGKGSVVTDDLSHMTMGSVSPIEEANKDLAKDIHRLAVSGVQLEDSPNGGFMVLNNSVIFGG